MKLPVLKRASLPLDNLCSYRIWASLYIVMVWFLLGMEWLFFVTKPSFLSVLDWGERANAFAAGTVPLLLAGLVILGALWLVGRASAFTQRSCQWLLLGPGRHLFDQVLLRVWTRVEQLAGEGGADPFEEVTDPISVQFTDENRMRQVARFIQNVDQPFFAHVHIMVTHGPKFVPRHRRFSAGLKQEREMMPEFYDDAILEADDYAREIVSLIEQRGAFENTLVEIYSDHGARSQTNVPLPLMVRLPGGRRRGRVGVTAQTIDIAPTILDVLAIRTPRWMEGQSLLGEVPPCRPVIGAISTDPTFRHGEGIATARVPPFYSLGVATLVRGDRWLYLEVDHRPPTAHGGRVPLLRGAETCRPFASDEAEQFLIQHLRSRRYQIRGFFDS